MLFSIKDEKLVEKYLKTKLKFYNGKIHKHFHNNEIPNEGS